MTLSHHSPLVFVRLLANHRKQLAAFEWLPQPEISTERPGWLDCPEWPMLAAARPCLLAQSTAEQWPEAQRRTWAQLGADSLNPQQVIWAERAFPQQAPQTYVAGPWYLQAPTALDPELNASRQRALALLQLLNTDAETHELEEVFRHDANLSYALLRLVNSPALRRPRPITSFAQAILLLGRQQLQRWVSLLLFAAHDNDERSALLMAHVCLRARGMELLAQASGGDRAQQDQAFMTGMLSMVDVLLGQALPALLADLPLSEHMLGALLRGQGELATYLHAWQAAESANADALLALLDHLDVRPEDFNHIMVQNCVWMLELNCTGAAS